MDTQYISGDNGDDWLAQFGGKGSDSQKINAASGNDFLYQAATAGDDIQTSEGFDGNDWIYQSGGKGNDDITASGGVIVFISPGERVMILWRWMVAREMRSSSSMEAPAMIRSPIL